MSFTFRPVTDGDGQAIIDIFNHYVENSFAAFPERRVPYEAFAHLRERTEGFAFYAVEKEGKVVGFGMLRPHSRMETLGRAAEVSYFILPEYTGWGVGSDLLARLVEDARARGVDTILASVSSENERSIHFHERHGFVEAGRLRRVGRKFGKDFDVVWLQLFI